MSPLLRKEIRLILPFWGIAIVLAVAPVWFLVDRPFLWTINEAVFWLLGFGLLLLGLAPFGQEFGLGTFSMMLAQPFERRRIWKTKILLVVAAAAVVFLTFIVTLHTRIDLNISRGAERFAEGQPYQIQGNMGIRTVAQMQRESENHMGEAFREAVKISLLLIAVAITGGFWTTLLFRQTGAAMWFAVLIPGALVVIVGVVFHGLWPEAEHITLVSVLVLYSLSGLIWAHRMFASAQDSQWLGETVAILSLSPAKRRAEDTTAPHRQGAFRALVRKEFQSHQISLLVAFGLLVLHLCTLVFRGFETLPRNSELRFVVEAVPFLWLLVPWLIGCVTVAEERKLGTMESQLCLPVTRRFQFAIKLAVALLLGLLLGGIMPVLIETIGSRFHVSSELVGLDTVGNLRMVAASQFALGMCLAAISIGLVSFFASTLCRNTLHALGGAMVLGCAFFFLFQWVRTQSNAYEYSTWNGPLIFIMGVPVAIVAVLWLSFSNYKRLHAGRSVWLRSFLTLVVVLAFTGIAAAFVYQRPWELAMSLEPQHGAPRLSGPIRPAIAMLNGRIVALLPDGRLWSGADYREQEFKQYEQVWDSAGQGHLEKLRAYLPTSGTFIGGSNWVAVATDRMSVDVVALQSDGTLWNVLERTNGMKKAAWFSLAPELRRIGTDSHWKSVATSERYFLAVKEDGTLWVWGNNDGRFGPEYGEHIPEPVRLGTDSDWDVVFGRYSESYVMKTNGAIFRWMSERNQKGRFEKIRNFNGKDWLALAGWAGDDLVLRRDGTLWGRGYLRSVVFGNRMNNGGQGRSLNVLSPIGHESDWIQISGEQYFAGIRRDGSLVKSDTDLFSFALGQPSKYSDWLTLENEWNGLLALASDGTISLWVDARSGEQFLLAPTHRPLWSLNIFAGSKN